MPARLFVMVNKPNADKLVELSFDLSLVADVYGVRCPEFTRYVHLECALNEKNNSEVKRFPIRVGVGAPGVPRDKLMVEGMREHCVAWWVHSGDYLSLPDWSVTHVIEFLRRSENASAVYEVGQ